MTVPRTVISLCSPFPKSLFLDDIFQPSPMLSGVSVADDLFQSSPVQSSPVQSAAIVDDRKSLFYYTHSIQLFQAGMLHPQG